MSLVDQLLFSGSNFLLNVLLARWLEPAQYGAFTLANAAFLLLGTLHNALFTEPMMVFGSGAYAGRFRQYLGLLIAGHLLLVVPLALLLWGAAFAFGRLYSREVQQAFWGFALASPLILWLWLPRRACYVRLRPGRAALGGALYSVLLLGSVFLLRSAQRLSQEAAGIAMGLCALPTIIYLVLLLHPRLPGQPRLDAAGVVADHWRYGRWALGTAALSWLPANLYYALLPLWAGLEDVAGLRVLTNLAVPVLNTISALSFLLLPMLGRHRRESPRRLLRTMKLFLALFAGGSTLYLGVVVLFRTQLLQLLYGGKYAALANLVPLACLLPYLFGFTTVMGAALRAMERPDRIFWCYAGSNLAALAFGILMARAWGVRGALAGLLLSASITGILMLLFFRAVYRQMAGPPEGARSGTLRWLDSVLVERGQAQFSAGPPSDPRWRPMGSWAWLGLRDARALLLPLDSRAVSSGALDLYRPRLPGARLLKALLLFGLRTGLARLALAKVRIGVRRDPPPTDCGDVFLLDYLREVLGREDLLFGIYAGAAGAVRKPVVAILSPEGQKLGFAKIGWNQQTCALVENEKQTLEHLAAHPLASGRFPIVRHFSRWHGRCVLITDPLPLPDGLGVSRAARKLLERFLSEVALLGKSRIAFGKSEFYARLLRRRETLNAVLPAGHPPVLAAAIDWLSAELGPEEIPCVWRLGDFSPWNLGIDKRSRRISAIDVEYAERDSIPGWDIFHYVSQAAGRKRLDVAAAVRHGWLGYFEALRVDPLLIPMLYAAYLGDLYTLWAELWHESGQPISARAAEILDRLIQLLGGLLQRQKPARARG